MSYAYNAVGQLNQAVSDTGTQYLAATTYNPAGQVTEQRLDVSPNGLTRQYVYETNTLRLSVLKAGTASPWESLQKLTYTYDFAGNVTSLTDATNSSQKQCFQYDWLHRLTAAFTGNADCTAYSGTGTGPYNHSYVYNAIGNITSYAGNSYTYGAKPHAVTGAFGNSYGYDAVGNQTSRTIAGTAYTQSFDYDNRLLGVAGGSVSATFLYDADGNRVKGTVAGVTTVYIAGLYEYQNGAVTKYYEGGAFRRIGYTGDNGVFYALSDHLRSTSVLVNQNGTVNGRNYFYPYGGNRNGAFSGLTTKRFTGQYHESGLPGGEGLYYYNARWYDARLARFVSADTIVPNPGNPQSLNRYSYVLGNPLKYTDPTGHAECRTAEECRDMGTTPMGTGEKQSRDRNLTQFAVAQAQMMADSAVIYLIALYNGSNDPGLKASAYLTFAGLVGDGKPWDLKDTMLRELGKSSMLCSTSVCYWFEYSVLGNILYGYVGTQAGFSEGEIRIGAGYAEARDPENSARYNWPAAHPVAYLPAERRPYYYDDPLDYNAVSMGIELSRRHGGNVTLQAFQALVTEYHELMTPGTPDYTPVEGPGGPYHAGHFDNRPR